MKKIFIVLLSVFVLSGCSTKFAYKNIDWLIYWYLGDYIELTDDQEAVLDEHLEEWLVWHKNNELPQYLDHLDEIVSDIQTQQMSYDRIFYHRAKARAHWERFREHVSSDLVNMAMSLSEQQIEDFFESLADDIEEREEKLAKELAKSSERQKNNWIRDFKDNSSDWIGRLNDEQKQFVENSYDDFTSSRHLWIDYNKKYQAVVKEAFENRQDETKFKSALLVLINNPEQYRSEELVSTFEKNASANVSMLLTILTLSTEKQQKKLIKEIGEYRQDVIDLIEWEAK